MGASRLAAVAGALLAAVSVGLLGLDLRPYVRSAAGDALQYARVVRARLLVVGARPE